MSSSVEQSRPKKRATKCIVSLLCLLLIAFAGWRMYRQTRLRQFGVVEEGVLYCCGQPTGKQMDRLVDEYGLKTVVNLRSNVAPDQDEYIQKHGLRLVTIPMRHTERLSDEWAEMFLGLVDSPENHPILVHCSEGQTRTGAMVALYRRRRCGWTREQTLEEMRQHVYNFAKRHEPLTESVLTLPEERKAPKPDGADANAQPAAGGSATE